MKLISAFIYFGTAHYIYICVSSEASFITFSCLVIFAGRRILQINLSLLMKDTQKVIFLVVKSIKSGDPPPHRPKCFIFFSIIYVHFCLKRKKFFLVFRGAAHSPPPPPMHKRKQEQKCNFFSFLFFFFYLITCYLSSPRPEKGVLFNKTIYNIRISRKTMYFLLMCNLT